jgi:D-arginine dehydrogenase
MPALDPEAEDLLVDKLLMHAPGLADISLRRSWACLRTFAPDRLPVIGWDPEIDGLFHVSGLGGFGVTTSLAIGEVASTLICGGVVDWIEVGSFSPRRAALRSIPQCNN